MEPEEDPGSASQNQNLHDLQNYLVTFKNEIESSDDVLPNIDVDGGDVSDLYTGSGTHLQDPGDNEVSGQFSSGFYSEQGMLGTSLSDEPTQQQIQSLVSPSEPEVDSEISSTKDEGNNIDLDGVQAQIASFGDSQLNQAITDIQAGSAHQGIIMTSLGDGLDANSSKMIQIVSLGGDDGQYLSLGDGQQMQILNSEDLGLTSESLEPMDTAVDTNSVSSATAINSSNPQMALVSLPGSAMEMPSSSGMNIMAPDNKDGNSGLMTAPAAGGPGLFNPGFASLVALPAAGEGGQPQLFALHQPGISSESLQMTSLLGADGVPHDLACQTITIMPSDLTQSGEMNYIVILSQPDGTKDGVPSMAQICDIKQETTEITDTIVDENGETKNVLRLIPKKLVNDMGNQQLVCDYCNYTSPKRYLLTRHMKSHSEERPFKCDACNRGFKTPASLLNHVNTHTGTRPHKCKTCEAAFTTSGELVRHIRYRHTFEKPHSCPQCDYASVELSKLKRHMRSHTGERPYKCPSCPYASPDTYKLKRHMRIHTGEKPYECDICHARFTQSNSLKAHKLIHTGNKPIYQCSLCPTTCGRKTDLKIHFNKLHAVGSPLDCKKCGKAFSDRYSYKQHIRSHDMEKCFKCDQCDFMAATEKNLELHMSAHGRKYECEECHLSFILKHLLDKHKAMFHPNSAKDITTEGKSKDESDSGFVTVLDSRYDLSELHSESEESSNLLSAPSASDTLHKNLMQDIKEGKLGDVPQVVIVHPDGSQEEISSKLTGDKWSIEELFSTATNNGQTRSDDAEKVEGLESKEKESQLGLPPSDDPDVSAVPSSSLSSSSSSSQHPMLGTTVDEVHDPMIAEESQQQESCFTHSEASQLCEASTQAEIESDTDSSGETPDHEMLTGSHNQSEVKQISEVEEKLSKPGVSTLKTLPSSFITLDSSNQQEHLTGEPIASAIPTTFPTSLPSQKSIVIKSFPSSSASQSTKKLTSILHLPKVLQSSPNVSFKTNSSQQYSLLKHMNLKTGTDNAYLNSGKDPMLKPVVTTVKMESNNSILKDTPCSSPQVVLKLESSSLSEVTSAKIESDLDVIASNRNVATSQDQINESELNSSLDNLSKETETSQKPDGSDDTDHIDQMFTCIPTIGGHSLSKISEETLSSSSSPSDDKKLFSSITGPGSKSPAENTLVSEPVSSTDNLNIDRFNEEFDILSQVEPKDNLHAIFISNSCDLGKHKSLSNSESENSFSEHVSGIVVNHSGPKTDSVNAGDNSDSIKYSDQPKSKDNVDEMSQKEQACSVPETNITTSTRKSKTGKRHADMDQSLVMTGKRMRKALIKVSL